MGVDGGWIISIKIKIFIINSSVLQHNAQSIQQLIIYFMKTRTEKFEGSNLNYVTTEDANC